jgi:hypothetical protein
MSWLQLQMTHWKINHSSSCFCSRKTFRHLFHVIYSPKFKSWNINLNSGLFCRTLNVKKKSHKPCKRSWHKYPGIWAYFINNFFKLAKKVCSTGSILDKKYTRQNAVLRKSSIKLEPELNIQWLTQAAKQTQFSTTPYIVTKKLRLWLHIIRQVQAIDDGT